MAENILKPQIRFKGFTDSWEQRELGSIFQFERPDAYMVNDDHYSEEGIPVLTANKAFILGYKNEDGAYDKGECIIFDDFTLDSKYVDFEFKVNSSAIKILTNKENTNLKFNYYLLNSTSILQQGHARHYISIVQPTVVKVPYNVEADKIESFFSTIDNLITLHQRKYEKLLNVKKGLLEKMFPAGEKCKPQIRFKGFADPWEQHKLSYLSIISKGQQLNKSLLTSDGAYYVLNGGMTPSGYTDSFNTKANTISISEGGNSCGFVAFNSQDFWSGGHNYTLSQVKIDNEYLYQYLKSQESFIMSLRVGSGLPNVQKSRVEEINISYPKNKREQILISRFLRNIDSVITLHQRKCEKLINMKKALLEKMFC